MLELKASEIRPEEIPDVVHSLKIIQPSDWEVELFGMGNAITVNPEKGKVPCALHRLMQRLILGNKWKRKGK